MYRREPVEWLNYHHLLYFWVVAKEGSVAAASKELRLAQPTISTQIHQLEKVLGKKLFTRRGRGLALTEDGQTTFRYADEIFSLGQELVQSLEGNPPHGGGAKQLRLVVGVSDVLAKSIVHKILTPAFELQDQIRIVCRENRSVDAFMGELAAHTVDVVLADAPAGPGTTVRAFSHPLGECGLSFFAAPKLARSCRRNFPRSLDGVPFLSPCSDSTLCRSLNEWFDSLDIRPKIVAELDDSALTQVLGEAGLGVFAVADVVANEIKRRFAVQLVGHTRDVRQRFYAISVERKIKHPGVAAICEIARRRILSGHNASK
jgi:LysR family transcriptional regulator, transcriptional activator of nhaA